MGSTAAMLFQVVNFSFDIGFQIKADLDHKRFFQRYAEHLGEDMLICGRTIAVIWKIRVFNGAYTAHIDNRIVFFGQSWFFRIFFSQEIQLCFFYTVDNQAGLEENRKHLAGFGFVSDAYQLFRIAGIRELFHPLINLLPAFRAVFP